MEEFAKYTLLHLLILPFVFLATDALGKTRGLMIKVVPAVAAISFLLAFVADGSGRRPNVAAVFGWAFVAWPFALLIAKGVNPKLEWSSLWLSVPVMSWYLVNVSLLLDYPVNGGGGGFGGWLAFVAGWFYMVVPFALLSGIFVGVRAIVRRTRGERGRGRASCPVSRFE